MATPLVNFSCRRLSCCSEVVLPNSSLRRKLSRSSTMSHPLTVSTPLYATAMYVPRYTQLRRRPRQLVLSFIIVFANLGLVAGFVYPAAFSSLGSSPALSRYAGDTTCKCHNDAMLSTPLDAYISPPCLPHPSLLSLSLHIDHTPSARLSRPPSPPLPPPPLPLPPLPPSSATHSTVPVSSVPFEPLEWKHSFPPPLSLPPPFPPPHLPQLPNPSSSTSPVSTAQASPPSFNTPHWLQNSRFAVLPCPTPIEALSWTSSTLSAPSSVPSPTGKSFSWVSPLAVSSLWGQPSNVLIALMPAKVPRRLKAWY